MPSSTPTPEATGTVAGADHAETRNDAPPAPPGPADLLREAERLYEDDKLLAAARLLREAKAVDAALLTDAHMSIIRVADDCEHFVASLKSPVDGGSDGSGDGWTKQGESHGSHDTAIYYRVDTDSAGCTNLTARVETTIQPSLLVPLLSVLNETELYATWLPRWERPVRLGVTCSEKLNQSGRASQTILIRTTSPWPMAEREVVLGAVAFDDIDCSGDIAVRLRSMGTDEKGSAAEEGIATPPPKRRAVRVVFDGGFLFRRCPPDHPVLSRRGSGGNDIDGSKRDGEDMLLASFLMYLDSKVPFLPQTVINFIVRTVIGKMWEKFLLVADDVKEGRRPRHSDAIAAKRECLYNWVDERVDFMLTSRSNPEDTDDGSAAAAEAAAVDEEMLRYLQC